MGARTVRLRVLAMAGIVALLGGGCAWIQRVNVDDEGQQGAIGATGPAISGNGRFVAFESFDPLGSGEQVNTQDVFVRDTATDKTRQVSVPTVGTQASGGGSGAAISADGRYVAFLSQASNLVAGDTNNRVDIFVRDTVAGTNKRVSLAGSGAQANGDSERSSISSDGRYVAFDSDASNLVPGDTNSAKDVFLRDTVAGTTTRVSVASGGTESNNVSLYPSISADGRSVVFSSRATNLVAGDTNAIDDVFLRDTVAGTTTRVSVGSGGAQGNGGASTKPVITANGKVVVFDSFAPNLVSSDTNGSRDVFARDIVAGTTARVSVDDSGNQLAGGSANPTVSADGRYVAFQLDTSEVPGHEDDLIKVLVRDRVAGSTRTVSVDAGGQAGNRSSYRPALSGDGRYVAFETDASNLVPDDTNGFSRDVVVRANPQPTVSGVSPTTLSHGTATPVSITGTGFVAGGSVVVDGPGTSVSNITIVSPTQITATVTVDPGAPLTVRNVWVELPGTGPGASAGALGLCAACVTVT